MPPDTATLTPAEYQAHHGLSVLGGWLPLVIDIVAIVVLGLSGWQLAQVLAG